MSRFFKIALVLVVAFCALCYFYAPARLAAIVALGRSPVCPMSRAIHSADELQKQIAYKDNILYASKLLEKDPAGYHLWDTPDGRYWIPQGSDYVLALKVPFVDKSAVDLSRHNGELYVTVGNYRREISLPRVLARRETAGASIEDGELRVRFAQRRTDGKGPKA